MSIAVIKKTWVGNRPMLKVFETVMSVTKLSLHKEFWETLSNLFFTKMTVSWH